MLYPAFPYPNFTQVTREDSDAIYAYLMNRVAPVHRVNTAHALTFPTTVHWRWRWRLLYFKPASLQVDTSQSAAWQRGATRAGPCALRCLPQHPQRARRTARRPRLRRRDDAAERLVCAVADRARRSKRGGLAAAGHRTLAAKRHLATGRAFGPMAEIVFQSTQYLSNDDALAMATYLKALPVTRGVAFKPSPQTVSSGRTAAADRGSALYKGSTVPAATARDGEGKRAHTRHWPATAPC